MAMNEKSKYFARKGGMKAQRQERLIKEESDANELSGTSEQAVKTKSEDVEMTEPSDYTTNLKSEDFTCKIEYPVIKSEHANIKSEDFDIKTRDFDTDDNEGDQPYWPHLHPPEGPFWRVNRVRAVAEAREDGMNFRQIAEYLFTHPLFMGGKLPTAGKVRIVYNKATGRREQ